MLMEILITSVVLVVILLGLIGTFAGKSVGIAFNQSATYAAVDFASAVNTMLGAPEGSRHLYPVPSAAGVCMNILPTRVEVTLKGAASVSYFLIIDGIEIVAPYAVNCEAVRGLALVKKDSKLMFEPAT